MGTDKDYPCVGDEFYVESALHIDRGYDDYQGGLVKISSVEVVIHFDELCYEICVEELTPAVGVVFIIPSEGPHSWGGEARLAKQEKLKESFGNQRAFHDPDEVNTRSLGWPSFHFSRKNNRSK
jgi:hypothetical protein